MDESTTNTETVEPQPAWSVPVSDIAESTQCDVQPLGEPKRTDGRDAKGHFLKGHGGNPTGSAKAKRDGSLSKELDGIVDRSELAKMLWCLSQGKDRHGRAYKRPNLSVQLAAVQYIYDRLEGKPLLQLRHEGDDLPTFIIMHGRDAKAAIVEGEVRELPEAETARDDLDVKRAPLE